MSINKIDEFNKRLELSIAQPLNLILEGENGAGKEYSAKLIHEKRSGTTDFIVFDLECHHSCQIKVLEDLVKNHLSGIMDFSNQKRNTYFFRRVDLLSWQVEIEIFELLDSEAKRSGLSRSQLHQLSLIASLEKKNGNGGRQSDLTLSPLLELFPLRIKVPALRQRRQELGSLMYKILESVNQQQNRKVLGFSFEALHFFLKYDWPNNIDELRSEIERVVTFTKDNELIKPQVLSEKLIRKQLVLRTDNFMS